MKIGIYYASTSGTTEIVTEYLLQTFGDDLAAGYDIEEVGFADIDEQDIVIFGSPTWDYGHLQSGWEERWSEFEALNLEGKTVALFGVGDQYGYPEWFLDAMGIIYQSLDARGVQTIGAWKTEGYESRNRRR